jgi:hypothetical protein
MDDSELFDVFTVDNNPEPEQKTIARPERPKSKKEKKGKKEKSKAKDNPIVVDSFETESDQIVRATTGLQGVAPTDENIVIKKKVN